MHVLLSIGVWSTAFVTFYVSWELFNVVLLVVKALSSRGEDIKASAHQFHYGEPLLFNSWALYPCADGQSKNRRDALVSFLLNLLSYIFWCIWAKKTFFSRLLFLNLCCIMPQNSSESENKPKLFGTKPHLCESQMTFDMHSRRFWNKSDTSWKYPAKISVRRSIFHRNTIYRSVIEVNWSPQISAHKEDGVSFSLLFLCVLRKTYRQTVSASAANLLRQKRKKRTLAETLNTHRLE